MSVPIDFEYTQPTKLVFGPGSVSKIGAELERLGAKSIFLVSDEGAKKAGIVDRVIQGLDRNKLKVVIFTDVEANPTLATVDKGHEVWKREGCDTLLGVGGGSSMDVAKGVGILAKNPGPLPQYMGIDKFPNPAPPLVAVPTTAGTASEVTPASVFINPETKAKFSIRSMSLYARVAILDPELLFTLPASLAASAGMDAFIHAFEAYVSTKSEPVTDGLCLQAMKLIAGNIRAFVADRRNLEAASNMLIGSTIAGMAFSNARLGAVHAMSHPLSAYYNLHHGLANAVLLPWVMEYNLIACVPRFAEVARVLGEPTDALSERDAAELAISAIRQLSADIGIPERLREVGAEPADFPQMAQDAWDQGLAAPNPRATGPADMEAIYRRAY